MTICERCGIVLQIGDYPFCPHGHGHANVNGDEIVGGMWQENGFHTPQQFFSKRERRRALAAKGLEERVCNAGIHDVLVPRWATMDPQTLKNAEILATRNGAGRGADPVAPAAPLGTWHVRDRC